MPIGHVSCTGVGLMGFRSLEEIHAYVLTREFKLRVYRLIRSSPEARSDWRFRSQVREALSGAESNIVEGFRRWLAPEFAHVLGFARASLQEGLTRLQDGIDREYFEPPDCVEARRLGERALGATTNLQTSLRRIAEENRRKKKQRHRPGQKLDRPNEDPGPKT